MSIAGTPPLIEGFDAIRSWTGRWQWNASTAVFTNPVHSHAWETQVQDVEASEDRLILRTDILLPGGVRRHWTFDGAFDGRPRPITWDDDGSVMTVIAFFQLGPLMIGDGYFAPDGSFAGSEYFTFTDDNIKLWGSSTSDGKHYTYFEEWDRIG